MASRGTHHRIVVVPSSYDAGPCVPDLDTDVIVEDLDQHMQQGVPYVAVCLGCGTAAAETQVLRQLRGKHGHAILAEVFLDKILSSALLRNVQVYVDATKTEFMQLPSIVTTFEALTAEITYHRSQKPGAHFLIFGIHASLWFAGKLEVGEFHSFGRCCEELQKEGRLHPEWFTNYLHESGVCHKDTEHVQPLGSSIGAFRRPWCDLQ